ncbi:MAG: gamma-glutamyltransferase family protein [Bryobacteraceae bacterium]
MRKLLVASLCITALGAQERRRDPVMRPMLRGRHHGAASMHSLATMAAQRAMDAGGNAFDAAVAGQAVLGVVQAASNGIGGDAMLLVYDARAKKVWSINAAGTAPMLATIDWYKRTQNGKIPVDEGLLAGTVPGVMDAWYSLLDRWGTWTFAQALAQAIDLAENGFPVESRTPGGQSMERYRRYPTTMRVLMPLGRPLEPGELYRNQDMARTLRRLVEAEKTASQGGRKAGLKAARDLFYRGAIAEEMAKFSEANGGLFRREDFARYSALVEEPVSTEYRGYRVWKNPSANQGPAELIALNLLEGYDLRALQHNSAAYIHTSIEALKLAFADRDKYMGDAAFVKIPFEGLLSKEYARERRKLIDEAKASLELRAGEPEGFMSGFEPAPRPIDVTFTGPGDHEGDTSYIVVADKDRNMVSFTPSLHSGYGTKVVMGDLGFSFNCRGDYFSLLEGSANALAGGKRPRVTLQGTIVTKDGEPFLATGSPGGDDQCMRTMQTLLNVVEFGMDIQRAIEAPRYSTRSFPSSPFPHRMYPGEISVEDRIPEPVRAALTAKGHKVRTQGGWSMNMSAGIVVDSKNGIIMVAADPRRAAYAAAW